MRGSSPLAVAMKISPKAGRFKKTQCPNDNRGFNKAHLIHGNCIEEMAKMSCSSVHCVITDPPYFIDGMDADWDKSRLDTKTAKAGIVGALPVGMKFDPDQGVRFEKFMGDISKEVYRVLKPGGFFISFSQARLYHRLAIAVETAGFEVRDMLGWKYEGQAKAFKQDHFIRKEVRTGRISEMEGQEIIRRLGGRKTPQLKPQIEPMVLAQKPRDGTFVNNWIKHEVGLVDVTQSLDGKFPGNIMEVKKPNRKEKGEGNDHLTVKPVALIEHLIRLFTIEDQIVLDPFMGSGTHGVAAINSNRRFVGVEIEVGYFRTSQYRIAGNA